MKNCKWEYTISILVSLAAFEFGLLNALAWYWSGFEWSPFGYETCGLEFLCVVVFAFPAFIVGSLIRFGLLYRWRVPNFVWFVPLLLCGIASCTFAKSLEMGIYCAAAMPVLIIVDFLGWRRTVRR